MTKLTWYNLATGQKVTYTERKRGKITLHVGIVLKVGRNQGSDTLVTVEFDGETKKVRLGDLEGVKKA